MVKDITPKPEFIDKIIPFKITEDEDNIYILDYTIPKSNNKENFKVREQIVWSIYGKWQAQHATKKQYNIALKSDILIRFEGISETVQKAARNYKYTMAMCAFDEVLQYAILVKTDQPKTEVENQRRYKEMLIMNLETMAFKPYFENIKMTVGLDLRTGIHRSYDQRYFYFVATKLQQVSEPPKYFQEKIKNSRRFLNFLGCFSIK